MSLNKRAQFLKDAELQALCRILGRNGTAYLLWKLRLNTYTKKVLVG
jgi:hypothetical protein